MARFYAKFDHSQDTTLNSDNFDPLKLGVDATAGGVFRTNLIASRSALSSDLYTDAFGIEAINRSGGRGTFIPSDVITTAAGTNPSVSMSFSAVYTASTSAGGLAGIIIPANFRTRPTASVLSTFNPALLGTPLPIDSGSTRNYNLYLSASNAVSASLSAINTGSNTPRGPYVRLGNNPSRTIHSIWHDADLTYFAWDDFTPGTPFNTSGSTINPGSTGFAMQLDTIGGSPNQYDLYKCASSQSLEVRILFSIEYFADKVGPLFVSANIREGSTSGTIYATLTNYQTTVASAPGKTLLPFGWQFNMSANQGVLRPTAGTFTDMDTGTYYLTDVTLYFQDGTIASSLGGTSTSYNQSTPMFQLTRTA